MPPSLCESLSPPPNKPDWSTAPGWARSLGVPTFGSDANQTWCWCYGTNPEAFIFVEQRPSQDAPATSPACSSEKPLGVGMTARREIGKWLNEQPNREVDRQALAELCAEFDRLEIGHNRYETVRRMNPQQWADAYHQNLETGKPFDEIIDGINADAEALRYNSATPEVTPAVEPSPLVGRAAVACIASSWEGRLEIPCRVVGETPRRYLIEVDSPTALPPGLTLLMPGQQKRVPKGAIRFTQEAAS